MNSMHLKAANMKSM